MEEPKPGQPWAFIAHKDNHWAGVTVANGQEAGKFVAGWTSLRRISIAGSYERGALADRAHEHRRQYVLRGLPRGGASRQGRPRRRIALMRRMKIWGHDWREEKMAGTVALLSFPIGAAFGVWMGRMAYKGDIPQTLMAIFIGLSAGLHSAEFLLDVARWLKP